MSELAVPDLALVVLIGASGSGKSTFARRYFRSTQVLSSDFCRGLVADDENDQAATPDAFEVLHAIAGVRLRRGLLTVVDPESGETLEVPTGNAEFRRRFAEGAAAQRRLIAAGLRRAGAGHLQLRTDRDWLMDVVRFVADRRRAGTGGASR